MSRVLPEQGSDFPNVVAGRWHRQDVSSGSEGRTTCQHGAGSSNSSRLWVGDCSRWGRHRRAISKRAPTKHAKGYAGSRLPPTTPGGVWGQVGQQVLQPKTRFQVRARPSMSHPD